MKKILYKDQPFYVHIGLSDKYTSMESHIRVYVKRTGFWKFIKKYKLVSRSENQARAYVTSRDTLLTQLESAYQAITFPVDRVMECIECSPEITSIYTVRHR
jgi:dynactin complex subunit